MPTKNEIIELKMKILEFYENMLEKGLWNEYIYLQEVNGINNIKDDNLKDVLSYLEMEDGDY